MFITLLAFAPPARRERISLDRLLVERLGWWRWLAEPHAVDRVPGGPRVEPVAVGEITVSPADENDPDSAQAFGITMGKSVNCQQLIDEARRVSLETALEAALELDTIETVAGSLTTPDRANKAV